MACYEDSSRIRRRKRQRLLIADYAESPLSMYQKQVTACSLKQAERTVSLHEANPCHVMLLMRMKQNGLMTETNSSDAKGANIQAPLTLLSFVETYDCIKEILTSCCSTDYDFDLYTESRQKVTNMLATKINKSVTMPFQGCPSVDVNAFISKANVYRKFCDTELFQKQIATCRALEAMVDADLASLGEKVTSNATANLGSVPTDIEVIMNMTQDCWRAELLHKLKSTLAKISRLS